MKKLSIFCSSIFVSLLVSAQVKPVKSTAGNNFCKVLSKVISNATDNFIKIQIGDDYLDFYDLAGNSIGQGWKTSVKFPGAMKSYIRRDEYLNNPYEAYFGSFKKLTDATKKLNSIKSQLSTCVKDYKVKVEKWDPGLSWGVPIRYEYTRKTNDLTQVVRLEISRSGTYYFLYLIVQGLNPLVLKSKADQELEDLFGKWPALHFDTTSVSPAQTKLAKQFQQLLDYAKDGFKAIKGKEVEQSKSFITNSILSGISGKATHTKYKTGFLPEDAEKSEIRYYPDDKSTKFIASYSYFLWPEISFRDLFSKMKKELGSDFVVEVDEQSINKKDYGESQKAVFYRKGSNLPQIELIYNSDTDTLDNGMPPGILIMVTALKNQSTVADNKPVTKDITGNETILKIWQNDDGKGSGNNKIQVQEMKSVKIGTQTWMAENLNTSNFRNGNVIQEAKTREEWQQAKAEKKPAWCYYNYDPAIGMKYGKLYNWYAVNDPRGLASKDWHVPGDDEWKTLIDFLGGKQVAGQKLKSVIEWKGAGKGTNESGFDGLPGGFCKFDGSWGPGPSGSIGYFGIWWSSTERILGSMGWVWMLTWEKSLSTYFNSIDDGLYVRCIKD
jgi:uncharacterized protein (TIGR02145 family)